MANIIEQAIYDEIKTCFGNGEKRTAMYLSGGIDSAIILYHLTTIAKKFNKKIYTYTANFGLDQDEDKQAKKVADHFQSIHEEVKINNIQDKLHEILPLFDKPRFNIWPYYLAEVAKQNDCKQIFIGEGADEVFGGYKTKTYLEAWADSIIYIMSTYKIIHKRFNLKLCAPYLNLDWKEFSVFHHNPDKYYLRLAYKNILPDFITDMKSRPPACTNYISLGKKEFPEYFNETPKNQLEARKIINKVITYLWLSYQQ